MKGVLLSCNNEQWVEMHFWLKGNVLNISKDESFDEIFQKIEITENTNITLIDRCDEPCFIIENPQVGFYKLKAKPANAYSWVFALRSCFCKENNIKPDEIRVVSKLASSPYGESTLCEYENVLYVINQFSKQKLSEYKSVESHIPERNLIFSLPTSPYILNLWNTFQDENNFYIWLEYPVYGELLSYLSGLPAIPDDQLRFYIAEIIVGLEFMHKHFIVFRDLCPANILLTKDWHIKLGAYGTHKSITGEHSESEYLAPEVIKGEKYDHKADWWSLGVILYQILFEETPFIGESDEETRNNILTKQVKFRRFKGSASTDLIAKLLERDPTRRIDVSEIEKHPFFNTIDWDMIRQQIVSPTSLLESDPVDFSKALSTEFGLDSELLPASSAYIGLEAFSLGNEYSSNDAM